MPLPRAISILIVTLRILYNIHGFGEWVKSLSDQQEIVSLQSDIVRTETGLRSREKDSSANGDGIPSGNGNDSEAEDSDYTKIGGDTSDILKILRAQQKKIDDSYEFNKDLYSYLKFCKEVVFAGLEILFEDYNQSKVMGELWVIYRKNEVWGIKDSTLSRSLKYF